MCEGSIKKHFTQMNKAEIWYLKTKINCIKKNELSNHVIERMREKNISEFEIRNVFKDYKLIEYHRRYNDNRVLIRSNNAINGWHTVISVSLDNGNIITGYKNMERDKHKTINWSNYNKNLNILNYILESQETNINNNELKEM